MPDPSAASRSTPVAPIATPPVVFEPFYGTIVGADFTEPDMTLVHVAVDPAVRVGKWNVKVSFDPGGIVDAGAHDVATDGSGNAGVLPTGGAEP